MDRSILEGDPIQYLKVWPLLDMQWGQTQIYIRQGRIPLNYKNPESLAIETRIWPLGRQIFLALIFL